MSIKGVRVRYFAIVLAIIAIIFGSYLTFFQSKGFEKTTATIVSVEELQKEFDDEDTDYDVTVEYTVNGQKYMEKLDYYSPFFKVGKSIDIRYDPNDPSVIHGGTGFGIYGIVVGVVILVVTIISIIRGRQSLQKLKEFETVGKDATYPAPFLGEERELYFLTDLGTPKYGHRIEDADRHVLIEAKMTKYTLTAPFGFDLIDHVNGKTTAHLVGHEETTEWNMILFDNHCTFQFDGEDIWKHLKRNGIRVDSSFGGGSGKLVGVNYTIYRDDIELARVESTSQYVHEEDAAVHGKIGSMVPISGFFRIWTREQNLELLFLTLLAFARTGASADTGGNYKTIFNTFKNQVNKRKENGEQ
ncbi:MAG: DUF3592 domain-containing protein [Lachnospiraceae bacterium]|nr:DUF3592 domain-containing protein [Lachnospiraceae bacterium]